MSLNSPAHASLLCSGRRGKVLVAASVSVKLASTRPASSGPRSPTPRSSIVARDICNTRILRRCNLRSQQQSRSQQQHRLVSPDNSLLSDNVHSLHHTQLSSGGQQPITAQYPAPADQSQCRDYPCLSIYGNNVTTTPTLDTTPTYDMVLINDYQVIVEMCISVNNIEMNFFNQRHFLK